MTTEKPPEKKQNKTIYLKESDYLAVKQLAKLERRSINNFIENIILEYINKNYQSDLLITN